MDLIYATSDKTDIGILHDYEFDLAYGVGENDFSLTLELSQHCCEDDYLIYMVDTQNGIEEPTEYGGIIDAISVDTSKQTVTYTGRTWHGILSNKIVEPEEGQDYRIVTGDAHEIIRELLEDAGLSALFTTESDASKITIPKYQFARYTDMYRGITDMLATNGGKLLARYENKMIVLSAVWLVDYSQDEEWDSSQVDFKITNNRNPVNHLVCLGQGDLKDRYVIHLFTDNNGGIRPYAITDEPVRDSDYILDKRSQVLHGQFEVYQSYDNSTAEFTENYVLLTSQPADWATNYKDYFTVDENGRFNAVTDSQEDTFTALTSQPADWTTRYSNYYTASGENVSGVETERYVPLTSKPSDWDKNWNNYFVRFWDGTQWLWMPPESISGKRYILQTQAPSDWQTNFGSYYMLEAQYEIVKNAKGETVTDKDGNPLEKKVGVGYVSVQKIKQGQKEVVPTWTKGKYYTGYPYLVASSFTSGLKPKYKHENITSAPTFVSGSFYAKTTVTVIPPWISDTYYIKYIDHYASLVRYGIERLKEEWLKGDKITINLSLLGEYDVGDIVGARDNATLIEVWQPITKKVVKIKNNQETITYEIGAIV